MNGLCADDHFDADPSDEGVDCQKCSPPCDDDEFELTSCLQGGDPQQDRVCITIVDGGWTPWTEWSDCTAGCGAGTRGRRRSCTDPTPGVDGLVCAGPTCVEEVCNGHVCDCACTDPSAPCEAWGVCFERVGSMCSPGTTDCFSCGCDSQEPCLFDSTCAPVISYGVDVDSVESHGCEAGTTMCSFAELSLMPAEGAPGTGYCGSELPCACAVEVPCLGEDGNCNLAIDETGACAVDLMDCRRPCSGCGTDERLVSGCDGVDEAVCEPCAACPDLTFTSVECGPDAPDVSAARECEACHASCASGCTGPTNADCLAADGGTDAPDCGSGYWTNGASCDVHTDCDTFTEVETVPPTATSDRECGPPACQPNEYELDDASCETLTECASDEYEVAEPTETSDRVCAECDNACAGSCTGGSASIADCDGCATQYFADSASGLCTIVRGECDEETEYEETAATATSDRVCGTCDTACAGACTGGSASIEHCGACALDHFVHSGTGLCTAVRGECDSLTEFEASAPTASSDRVCSTCATCAAGDFVASECTSTTDTVCVACATCGAGDYAAVVCAGTQDTQCAACAVCGDAQYEQAACTEATDTDCRACVLCEAGVGFDNGGCDGSPDDTKCEACSLCGTNTYATGGCDGVEDTTCSDCAECVAGETYQLSGCHDGTTDRECAACSACEAGTFVTVACTPTSNTVCEPCHAGCAGDLSGCNATSTSCTECHADDGWVDADASDSGVDCVLTTTENSTSTDNGDGSGGSSGDASSDGSTAGSSGGSTSGGSSGSGSQNDSAASSSSSDGSEDGAVGVGVEGTGSADGGALVGGLAGQAAQEGGISTSDPSSSGGSAVVGIIVAVVVLVCVSCGWGMFRRRRHKKEADDAVEVLAGEVAVDDEEAANPGSDDGASKSERSGGDDDGPDDDGYAEHGSQRSQQSGSPRGRHRSKRRSRRRSAAAGSEGGSHGSSDGDSSHSEGTDYDPDSPKIEDAREAARVPGSTV